MYNFQAAWNFLVKAREKESKASSSEEPPAQY